MAPLSEEAYASGVTFSSRAISSGVNSQISRSSFMRAAMSRISLDMVKPPASLRDELVFSLPVYIAPFHFAMQFAILLGKKFLLGRKRE